MFKEDEEGKEVQGQDWLDNLWGPVLNETVVLVLWSGQAYQDRKFLFLYWYVGAICANIELFDRIMEPDRIGMCLDDKTETGALRTLAEA